MRVLDLRPLAAYISRAILPSADEVRSLAFLWATFAGTFLVRPLGWMILARLADRAGGRGAMYTSVWVRTAATSAICFIPVTTVAGAFTPPLFVVVRPVQILSVGEPRGALPHVTERVLQVRRARMASVLTAGTFAAALCGSLIEGVLSLLLTTEQMDQCGRPIPFLLAVPLGVCALILRRRAPESRQYERPAAGGRRERSAVRAHGSSILVLAGISLTFDVVFAAALTGYLTEMLVQGLSPAQALPASMDARLRDAHSHDADVPADSTRAHRFGGPGRGGYAPARRPGGALDQCAYLAVSELFPACVRATGAALRLNAATAVTSLVPLLNLAHSKAGVQDGLAVCVFTAAAVCAVKVCASGKGGRTRVE